jgi:hypothetical protein
VLPIMLKIYRKLRRKWFFFFYDFGICQCF